MLGLLITTLDRLDSLVEAEQRATGQRSQPASDSLAERPHTVYQVSPHLPLDGPRVGRIGVD